MANLEFGLDPGANPYAPGAGIRPPFLAGRDTELADVTRVLQRASIGYVDQPRLAVGVRGVGKTVLLLAARDLARQAGAVAVHVQARSGEAFIPGLLRELDYELGRLRGARGRIEAALRVVASVAITVGGVRVSASPQRGRGDSGDLAVDLVTLFEAVTDASGDHAVLMTIDEFQELPEREMSGLLVALQRAAGDRIGLVTIAAGLPGVLAAAADVESFAERMFTVWSLGPLDRDAALLAITEPARNAGGVSWDKRAVDRLVEAAAGYPFYLQHFAASVWDAAAGSPIMLDDVASGLDRAERQLSESLVEARYQRLSPRERAYVRALAELGPGVHGSGEVAAAMGTSSSKIASARARLIRSGVVYGPAHGKTAFTLPLFDRYVRRLATD